MRYKTTPITMSLHPEDENPIFGENAIHVTLMDEAAGPFLSIKTLEPVQSTDNEIRLDFEQLELVMQAAKTLMDGVKEEKE